MTLARIEPREDFATLVHFECKPCGVSISDAVEDMEQGNQTLQ
jgi:hypothetical protein